MYRWNFLITMQCILVYHICRQLKIPDVPKYFYLSNLCFIWKCLRTTCSHDRVEFYGSWRGYIIYIIANVSIKIGSFVFYTIPQHVL